MAYKGQLATLENNYMALVNKFYIAYPDLVSAAAFQLGDLFNRDEYPSVEKITSKFKFEYNFMPVPTAGDFRIDINEEAKNDIISSCSNVYETRLNNAMRDAWARLHDCLTRMSERLTVDLVNNEDGSCDHKGRVFRNSLVENAVELTELLKHFNLTNDESLEDARRMLATRINGIDADALRDNFTLREQVKKDVDSILNKFNF
jgi:hypothetical protein